MSGFACRGIGKDFISRRGKVTALADVSFTVAERELVCIVGPSGCGKTTLLRLLAGLIEPERGAVTFSSHCDRHGGHAALVFQDHGLFPWMTVLANVAFGLEMQGVSRREREDRARVFIERFGLASFAEHYPFQLSVGMRQRVGIARAFLAGRPVLLMDEPFGSVDAQTRQLLQEELLRLWSQEQKTVLFITHDIEEAILLGQRILVMSGRPGTILEEIPVPLRRPRDASVLASPEAEAMRRRIWSRLERQVRQELGMGA